MDIEALVKKHGSGVYVMEKVLRAALTELAEECEQSLERLSQINAGRLDLIHRQEERIRQLEAERVLTGPCNGCGGRGWQDGGYAAFGTACRHCNGSGKNAAAPQQKKEGE